MRLFKDVKGNNIDPVNHTLSILKNYPHAKIHIGSDSQNIGKKTNYTSIDRKYDGQTYCGRIHCGYMESFN